MCNKLNIEKILKAVKATFLHAKEHDKYIEQSIKYCSENIKTLNDGLRKTKTTGQQAAIINALQIVSLKQKVSYQMEIS